MKSTILFGFIAFAVFFSISSVSANDEKPLFYDITGDWYVVATSRYHEKLLSKFRCWKIQISESEIGTFAGISIVNDTESDRLIKAQFTAHKHESTSGGGGDEYHYFDNIKVNYDEAPFLAIRSMRLWYSPKDPVAALTDIYINEDEFIMWNTLFISRRSDITPDMVPRANEFINNTDCSP